MVTCQWTSSSGSLQQDPVDGRSKCRSTSKLHSPFARQQWICHCRGLTGASKSGLIAVGTIGRSPSSPPPILQSTQLKSRSLMVQGDGQARVVVSTLGKSPAPTRLFGTTSSGLPVATAQVCCKYEQIRKTVNNRPSPAATIAMDSSPIEGWYTMDKKKGYKPAENFYGVRVGKRGVYPSL